MATPPGHAWLGNDHGFWVNEEQLLPAPAWVTKIAWEPTGPAYLLLLMVPPSRYRLLGCNPNDVEPPLINRRKRWSSTRANPSCSTLKSQIARNCASSGKLPSSICQSSLTWGHSKEQLPLQAPTYPRVGNSRKKAGPGGIHSPEFTRCKPCRSFASP